MAVGVITGTGTYALPGFRDAESVEATTPYGTVTLTRGRLAGVDVLHVSRHGPGHPRLSNHVEHRANLWALRELGARSVVGCTACGALEPTLSLGSLVVFDDLHFPSNRLPDGSLATFELEPGRRGRGHWIYDRPFSPPLRGALLEAAARARLSVREGGCYGHVDGPRFNTRTEIAQLASLGVTAVSQTGGPETVLAGELELPYALVGYATDHANGVSSRPTPLDELVALMERSTQAFAALLTEALPALVGLAPGPTGLVYRFDP